MGIPSGTRRSSQIADRLRQDGEAFRVGGDEFALASARADRHREAMAIAEGVIGRVTGTTRLSAGIVTYPDHGVERSELVRVADSALYLAKEHGKNRVRVYRPTCSSWPSYEGWPRGPTGRRGCARRHPLPMRSMREMPTRARTPTWSASWPPRVAKKMGLETEQVELARLAGSLHDLGKLAIPEEILRKPGPLNEAERLVLERHPQIGFRMLDSLGVEPVASWVLHHHERWDGDGYPDRLGGDAIPLGSRILFVADAYDAMTTDRVYRSKLSHERAISELERCAGTQFDPDVVAALLEELEESGTATAAAAGSTSSRRRRRL